MTKQATSYRLDKLTKRLIEKLATRWGISRTDAVKLAIREKAARDGVK
jgi:hypothetical protein